MFNKCKTLYSSGLSLTHYEEEIVLSVLSQIPGLSIISSWYFENLPFVCQLSFRLLEPVDSIPLQNNKIILKLVFRVILCMNQQERV
jgi:hypothetical protein